MITTVYLNLVLTQIIDDFNDFIEINFTGPENVPLLNEGKLMVGLFTIQKSRFYFNSYNFLK